MAGDIEISRLQTADLHQVSRFRMSDADDKPLEQFIRRVAKKSASANLTQTYILKAADNIHVLGYISIMCAEVKLEGSYPIADKVEANRYDYQPAVRIARLAVCDSGRGNGWGLQLVNFVIGIVLLSIQPHAGCRFLILDAKRKSVGFYEKLGFRLLDTEDNTNSDNPLMFMDLKSVQDLLQDL